ncbi:hypothetical protein Q6295_45765, partial [Klebsiella pneumoniae]
SCFSLAAEGEIKVENVALQRARKNPYLRGVNTAIQKLENRANSLIYQRYVALKTWLWAH